VERLAEARAHGLHRSETLEAAAEDAVGEAVAEAQVARHLEDEGRLAEAWLRLGLGLGLRVRARVRVRVRARARVRVRVRVRARVRVGVGVGVRPPLAP